MDEKKLQTHCLMMRRAKVAFQEASSSFFIITDYNICHLRRAKIGEI